MTSERDPLGKDIHEPGAKADAGKVRFELIQRGFARALHAVAKVATYGADKYTDDGWETVPNGVQRYTDALYRHLNAEHRDEAWDPSSKLPHAAHVAWNALARLELMARDEEAILEHIHGDRRAAGAVDNPMFSDDRVDVVSRFLSDHPTSTSKCTPTPYPEYHPAYRRPKP